MGNVFAWLLGTSKRRPVAKVVPRQLSRNEIIRQARQRTEQLKNELKDVNDGFDNGILDLTDIR